MEPYESGSLITCCRFCYLYFTQGHFDNLFDCMIVLRNPEVMRYAISSKSKISFCLICCISKTLISCCVTFVSSLQTFPFKLDDINERKTKTAMNDETFSLSLFQNRVLGLTMYIIPNERVSTHFCVNLNNSSRGRRCHNFNLSILIKKLKITVLNCDHPSLTIIADIT
jgi:hypothetical protein